MSKVAIVIIVLLLGVGVIVLARPNKADDASTNNTQSSAPASDDNNNADTSDSADNDQGSVQTVIYDQNGFSPEMLTSKAGEKITFENKSSEEIQVSSDPHPEHTENPELNVGTIEPGASKSVTLTTKGSFGVHNHFSPDKKTKVVVQ